MKTEKIAKVVKSHDEETRPKPNQIPFDKLSEEELAYINADYVDDSDSTESISNQIEKKTEQDREEIDKAVEARESNIDKKRKYNPVLDDILTALDIELDETNKINEPEAKRIAQKDIIFKYYEACIEVFGEIELNHADLIKKKKQFPPKWMKENKKIMDVFVKYRFLEKLLVAIQKMDNPLRAEKVKQIIERNQKVIGDQKHDGKPYHTFVKDKEFTEKLASKIGCSPAMIDKYFKAFLKYGILKSFGKVDRYGGGLYADGFMFEHGGLWHKAMFINKADHKKHLENFSI